MDEKQKITWSDLMKIPHRDRPTARGRGRGRGSNKLPSLLLMSKETMKYMETVDARTKEKEVKDEAKQKCVKAALAQKAKKDRLVRQLKKKGEL